MFKKGFQGAVAARNILLPFSDRGILENEIPEVIFTSPEIATIGLSARAAKEKFGEKAIGASVLRLGEVDRAICEGSTKGLVKIVYNKRGKKIIVGATIVAPVAGELISEISVAMKAKIPFDQFAKVIHPYPSYAIALQTMAADVYYEDVKKLRWLYNILKRLKL